MIRLEATGTDHEQAFGLLSSVCDGLVPVAPEVGEFVKTSRGITVRVSVDANEDGPTFDAVAHALRYLVPTIPAALCTEEPQHVAVVAILEALGLEHEPEPGDPAEGE